MSDAAKVKNRRTAKNNPNRGQKDKGEKERASAFPQKSFVPPGPGPRKTKESKGRTAEKKRVVYRLLCNETAFFRKTPRKTECAIRSEKLHEQPPGSTKHTTEKRSRAQSPGRESRTHTPKEREEREKRVQKQDVDASVWTFV